MANNEAGAFLNITPDVLKKLDSFDEKLERIEKHAHTAADALKSGFGSMVVDTSKLESAIASLAKKIEAIKGNPFEGAGRGAEETTRKTTSLNESLARAADLLNRIGNNRIGEGSFANMNIAGLKQGYSDLKKYVENMDLSKPQQKAAVEAMRYMKMELDEQRKTDEQRALSKEKETERRIAADRRAAKAAEDARKAQEYAQRTTPQGALDYSRNTKSLQQNVQAIEYLKKARLSLNTTDVNYKSTLEQINQAIAKHNQVLQQAGVQSQNLATRHRNLMDTTGQLSRQLALLFSVSQIEGYISKLANVRGEFELQQRSLEAILQNKTQADQIFNKTVQLAVKSPFQIKELVTFTKQLAAYRIESDKLYDTTKRLADVSAGLGVDMGRLILAYGQVKAAAYLRGTEVRQFTEAGINLYGELQRYFQEVKGEAYTTAQIVDMISKRKVTFEDIENIFQRLTDKGGLFYNMQEIQAETLQGKISNLKDSIDVMLNSIGKANEDTLKGSIDAVKVLIDNWETVVNIAKAFAPIIASMAITAWTKKIGVANGAIGLFSVGLGKAGNAIKAFGATFKASFPLMAITAALGVFNELIKIQDEYNKRQKEAENRYYKGKVRSSEIERISVTIDEKTSKPQIKEALNALVKEMNNEGFEIEIKANISEDEAKEQYDKLLKQHKQYLDDMLVLDYKYNADKKSNSMFWETDADEANERLTESYQKALATITQIRAELAKVADKGIGFIAQEELKELEQGVTESGSLEAIQDYYTKLLDFLESIEDTRINFSPTSAGGQSTITTTFAGIKSNILENVNVIKNSLDSSKNGMTEKIRSFFDNVFNFKNYDNDVKAAMVNNYAISHGWSQDFVQQITAPIYNIDFTKKRETNNNTGQDADTKLQRDILAERISLIKELNKEYEKLNKVMGSDKAAKTVMERYTSQLKDVKMLKNIIGDAFLPNKENTAKALQEFSKQITDFRKKIGAQKDANVLFDEKDAEDIKKQLDITKKNIEAMFNSLDLHQKLKDAGLSEAEVQQLFPGLAKTLDDVEKEMKASYEKNFPKGEYLVADTDANKQYLADLDKLNQQRIKEQQDLVIELTKAYKTQLTDQMQLDTWYIKERSKIYSKAYDEQTKTFKDVLTPEIQKQYEANLNKEYQKRTSENTWKNFQSTDYYIDMFEDLDRASTVAIKGMLNRLQELRSSLKDLPADQVRTIINQMERLQEEMVSRNPFKTFGESIKAYHKALLDLREVDANGNLSNTNTTYEALEESHGKNADKLAKIEAEKNAENIVLETLKQQYEEAEKSGDLSDEEMLILREEIQVQKEKTDELITQAEVQGKITKAEAEQLRNVRNLKKQADMSAEEIVNGIGQTLSQLGSELPNIAGNLENVFGTMSDGLSDTIDKLSGVMSGLGTTMNGVFQIMTANGNPFQMISGGITAISGLTGAIGSLFNNDKKLQRKIESHQKNIEKLGRDYDNLKSAMDNVWDITKLQQYGNALNENINKQIASLRAMIAAERDKKDTDQAKIDEWEQEITDLQNTLKDNANNIIAELGGVGSDANFKTLADNFASSWLNAFNETGNGLSGLEDSLDEFMQNYIKQQILLRLSDKYLKDLFDKFDNIIGSKSAMSQEDQERYFALQNQLDTYKSKGKQNNPTGALYRKRAKNIEASEEYQRLKLLYENFVTAKDINTEAIKEWTNEMNNALGYYNEAAEEIFNQIGWESGKKAELSSLTQSIQGITETTAEALESLLNSIRFFVSQQTTDISAIRALLDARYGLETEYSDSNPMLVELRAQTGYLEILSDRIDRVFAPSPNSKGAGIRVFMQ